MVSATPGRAIPVRLSLFYAALFLVIGVNLPFAPSYLATKGMGEAQIGVLLAAIQLSRLVGNPLIARVADAWGETRLPIILLCFLSLLGFALFLAVDGFTGLLILSLALGLIFTAVMPALVAVQLTELRLRTSRATARACGSGDRWDSSSPPPGPAG
jgi:PPP family 3-phenylpropionic acid transporter